MLSGFGKYYGAVLVNPQQFARSAPGGSFEQANLIQRQPCMDFHGEGPGKHLQVHAPFVASGDVVETVAVVCYDPSEYIQPSRGTLWICPGADTLGQIETLEKGDQVGAVFFQDGPVPDVDLANGKLRQLRFHG